MRQVRKVAAVIQFHPPGIGQAIEEVSFVNGTDQRIAVAANDHDRLVDGRQDGPQVRAMQQERVASERGDRDGSRVLEKVMPDFWRAARERAVMRPSECLGAEGHESHRSRPVGGRSGEGTFGPRQRPPGKTALENGPRYALRPRVHRRQGNRRPKRRSEKVSTCNAEVIEEGENVRHEVGVCVAAEASAIAAAGRQVVCDAAEVRRESSDRQHE